MISALFRTDILDQADRSGGQENQDIQAALQCHFPDHQAGLAAHALGNPADHSLDPRRAGKDHAESSRNPGTSESSAVILQGNAEFLRCQQGNQSRQEKAGSDPEHRKPGCGPDGTGQVNPAVDYKTRDIAEYIKYSFFYKEKSITDIINYLKSINLKSIDYLLLYIRLLYPSYYFDLYEEIINNGESENKINKIIELRIIYEKLLYEVYLYIKNKTNVLSISWLNNNYM